MGANLRAREKLGIMETNDGNISAALKYLSISAVGGLKTSLNLIRQLGYERRVLSESEFTDIVKSTSALQKSIGVTQLRQGGIWLLVLAQR